MSDWLAEGVSYLLSKTKETTNAKKKKKKKYQPITCLPTTHKMITSILKECITGFIEGKDIFPLEQNGYKTES